MEATAPIDVVAAAGAFDAHDLRGRTVRGAVASIAAQGAALVLRAGSMVVLSRLLLPRDFGLVAMATAGTGFLSLFRDFGLSTASVQRSEVTDEQLSMLFWVNVAAGGGLAAACALMAPALVKFYREPRLLMITLALAAGFLVNGTAVQHRALLQRQMRFGSLALIDIVALIVAIVASIAMAVTGFGYWAIVVMTLLPQVVSAAGVLLTMRWIPGRPSRASRVGPLLKFGGTLTLNSLVVYVAYNADKVLLGRFWGAEALGIYSRAFQLLNLPSDGLNSAISAVALPALSRVQHDAGRLRRNFVQAYSVLLAVLLPLTVACAVFAEDIVRVLLGAQWAGAAGVFRRLTPTMLVFALINPLSWPLLATGRVTKSLGLALVIAPTAIVGYWLGLPWGPEGVALGFSCAMLLLVIPFILWARQGTALTFPDIVEAAWPPAVSSAIAGGVSFVAASYLHDVNPPLVRLSAEAGVLFATFAIIMSLVLKDASVYWQLWSDANPLSRAERRSG